MSTDELSARCAVTRRRESAVSVAHYLHALCRLGATPLPGLWGVGISEIGLSCRGLDDEQHFLLARLWVYFIRWLLLIGAFWLYSEHLSSSWAG